MPDPELEVAVAIDISWIPETSILASPFPALLLWPSQPLTLRTRGVDVSEEVLEDKVLEAETVEGGLISRSSDTIRSVRVVIDLRAFGVEVTTTP